EDIDYCYRLNKNGWKIRYLPVTRLLHFKGESTKEKSYEYVKNFNLSMLRFFKKYYAFKYSGLFYIFIKTGVFLRGILLVIKNFLFFLFSNTINQLFKNEQNYLFIEGNSEFSIPNSYKRRNIKLHTSNLEFSKVLNNKWLNEIQFDIRKKTINKVIFDISIGYKVIFNIMEKLSALKIDFAFYYPEWNILMEKGGGEFLNNNVFYKDV
ncbi:MAG: hypothetical protein KAR38_08380, partial [Calditrichia bacterium]|nr:hypothetical protein [Calditrichia bacterium]